ncbi:UDP-N-acetylmuramoylalanine--D-glutamate ligase [Amycolatopsis bartoniae]|uniref:UDP-N-acetylmuramoylalanine--D-glutamate ligase n=1 Tax=Amycolatopsis bartoniae TaxID=941986 RepID=A0A8H9J1V1_9PSEU|nr:UDP-N-acetylmuramoyl-L-alanine--D-glutamate ligase [Amycolatopsis bartoniae]MBB2935434.1 UDP-N-acetylmuramoylalanine--D-glutamate ligase [Amycolatopsis bartoniae]TVT03700.1 UDP-N-acetylmuramoyl-L-alanine--D-glutamate ligase [Amycolatopsis bartoniae]GHF76023.1 UDP-N-acetylmuramoylalanine--D-glutamate ligase [Amycolatopsis bartoniae]
MFAGRQVLVAGAGVTGRSAVPVLLELGASVTVTDGDAGRLAEFEGTGARTAPGLTEPPPGTDLVLTSPGWRPTSPLLVAAAEAGIEVIGDVELAWRLGQLREKPPVWLAVTGTNGKTTTVGMLESILRAAGHNAVACGNVGFAVLDAVQAGYDVLAVELSSFQLHWSSTLAPHAAVVLNLAEDHLDWHGTMEAYAAAKAKLLEHAGVVVHNADDAWSTRLAAAANESARHVGFRLDTPAPGELGLVEDLLVDRAYVPEPATSAEELCTVADVRPAGPHNLANALAASALARAYGVSTEQVAEGLRKFQPGAHRAVEVGEVDGVRYINDSKATNPHGAASSLFAHESVVWIAGGLLKGAHVDDLVAAVAGRLRGAVLLGTDAGVIATALARHAPNVPVRQVPLGHDEPMSAAVEAARVLARPGDVVLLAPAAASMDLFRDYAHRGNAFADAVRELRGGADDRG